MTTNASLIASSCFGVVGGKIISPTSLNFPCDGRFFGYCGEFHFVRHLLRTAKQIGLSGFVWAAVGIYVPDSCVMPKAVGGYYPFSWIVCNTGSVCAFNTFHIFFEF